jgi:phosphatidate cytidylyltransferase
MQGANDASAPALADAATSPAAPQAGPRPPASRRPGSSRWADLRLRIISAAVLAPAALACLWVGGWLWTVLIAAATVGLFAEWLGLCRGRAASLRLLGVPYVGLAAASLVWLRFDPAVGRVNVLFVLLMVWASDIGAYLVGRLAGGPKLAPSISPGKTWSGAAGGVAASLLVAVALAGAAPWRAAIVAVVLSIVSQAGDLLESALKRHVGVKDSGRLIPGHGGLLDRLDGMLTAAPAAALLAAALGRGARLW